MFNFLCANCGATEMLHMRPAILYSCLNMKSWPDWEYFDDVPDFPIGVTNKVAVRFMLEHNAAYKHSPITCPGFEYKREDCTLVIESFTRHPQWDDFLPEKWRELYEHAIRMIEEEKDRRAEEFHLPSTTYIIIYPQSGIRYVAMGE